MTCARCGLPKYDWRKAAQGELAPSPTCGAVDGIDDRQTVACRDRQIAAQSALLRSVTGKLEEAAEIMQFFDEYEPGGGITARESGQVKALIASVLEVLS